MTQLATATASGLKERLCVINDNWGATSLSAVRSVLASAYEVLTDAFGALPDTQVRVGCWDQEPRALYGKRPYEIRLSARDRYWCQYVYQFSHELCHVMTGFDRYREHKHMWFEESLCELASLFVLHRLAWAWAESPPPGITGASEFAPNHKIYAENAQVKHPAVRERDLAKWFALNLRSMEHDPCVRECNGVVAVFLLGRFREDASMWRDCAWLNRWDPHANATFADYLDSWTACLRTNGLDGRVPALVQELFCPERIMDPPRRGRVTRRS